MSEKVLIVTPWHNEQQLDKFLNAWGVKGNDSRLVLQQDKDRSGCAVTKNIGIQHAINSGADIIIVLDDDCLPCYTIGGARGIEDLINKHVASLQPTDIELFKTVTSPQSRGTPFFKENRQIKMPVAASYGFWTEVGDYDAPSQLVHGATNPMAFDTKAIYGQYFAGSGMNVAFRKEWWPICQFINVSRFDDIWQGFIWQKIAYSKGYCFNMEGPYVRHSRQSNVWKNLEDEAKYLEANETLWKKIHTHTSTDYDELSSLLPV